MEFPEESIRLQEIIRKYMELSSLNAYSGNNLITCDDFEAVLQEFQDELKEPMNAVLRKLAESP